MGKHFGNLQKLTGVTYYTLSPLEINPFLMLVKPGLGNFIRKCSRVLAFGIVPVTASILIYDWGMKTYEQGQRKNPELYKDDV